MLGRRAQKGRRDGDGDVGVGQQIDDVVRDHERAQLHQVRLRGRIRPAEVGCCL